MYKILWILGYLLHQLVSWISEPSTVALENPPCWWYLMGKLVIFQYCLSLPQGISYCVYFQSIAFQQHCLNFHHPHRLQPSTIIKKKGPTFNRQQKIIATFPFFCLGLFTPLKTNGWNPQIGFVDVSPFQPSGGTFFSGEPAVLVFGLILLLPLLLMDKILHQLRLVGVL